MDWVMLGIVLVLVFTVGFLFAPLGLGGGMLFVPILHYVAGWPISGELILTSLMLTGVVAWGSGLVHRKEGLMDENMVKVALRGAIPGAVLGAIIVSLLDEKFENVKISKLLAYLLLLFAMRGQTKNCVFRVCSLIFFIMGGMPPPIMKKMRLRTLNTQTPF